MKAVSARILRRMGYLADRRGIAERYLQNSEAWEGHLQRTRQFILSCLKERDTRSIAVLGSGWMLDLPLEEISQVTGRVFLYDIAHPSQVIHLITKYRNITALTEDLTGSAIQKAYQAVRTYRKTGRKPDAATLFQSAVPDIQADLVISLNLLSQLGSMIAEYMGKYVPYEPEELDEINRIIQRGHIRYLEQMTSCLITDYAEVATDLETGQVQSKRLLFASLPEAVRSVEWEWDFDPDGTYYPGKKVVLKVVAQVFK